MICLCLGGIILVALYFSKQTIREGIAQSEFNALADKIKVATTTEPIKTFIEARDQANASAGNVASAQAAMKSANDNYKKSVGKYESAVNRYNADNASMLSQKSSSSSAYVSLIDDISRIGITDPMYSLLIQDTQYDDTLIINDLKLLIDCNVNIGG